MKIITPGILNQLVLAVLMLYSSLGHGDIREYDIEILIFEDTLAHYADSEKWPRKIASEDSDTTEDKAIDIDSELFGAFGPEQQFEADYPDDNDVINIASMKHWILAEEAEVLKKSRRYRILVHKSWRQTGLAKDDVISIPINSLDKQEQETLGNEVLIASGLTEKTERELPSSMIQGEIKLELARYLHLFTDLTYTEIKQPLLVEASDEVKKKHYQIKSHRKMRSKETHYVDHPLVGILIRAEPVKRTVEEKTVASE